MAVGGSVDAQNHPREVHMEPCLVAANKSTPRLMYVCAKTVEGYPKCQNVEVITDKKTLTIKGDNRHTLPQHRSIGVVAHAHTEVSNQLV